MVAATGPGTQSAPGSELLRFAAIGSVDDGKSTLIGRLLHDTKQLFDDQLDALSTASRRRGVDGVDLSFVTDGLRAEREQGITIDVAYRYASTPRRKFVIADCPGHVQYTRNMATGASTGDLAVVVVDATSGLREQTRRHCCIAALLGVRHMVVAVNKMDLTDWSKDAFNQVESEMRILAAQLGVETLTCIPVSALNGDNVVHESANAPWFDGPTLLQALEDAPAGAWAQEGGAGARLPVQWVVRQPGGGRSYAGMVTGGTLRPGDEVVVLPEGSRSRIASVETFDGHTRIQFIRNELEFRLRAGVRFADRLLQFLPANPAPGANEIVCDLDIQLFHRTPPKGIVCRRAQSVVGKTNSLTTTI